MYEIELVIFIYYLIIILYIFFYSYYYYFFFKYWQLSCPLIFKQYDCLWGGDSSLKIRVVTNPRPSKAERCLTKAHINNCSPLRLHNFILECRLIIVRLKGTFYLMLFIIIVYSKLWLSMRFEMNENILYILSIRKRYVLSFVINYTR